jgi:hypothetical protein
VIGSSGCASATQRPSGVSRTRVAAACHFWSQQFAAHLAAEGPAAVLGDAVLARGQHEQRLAELVGQRRHPRIAVDVLPRVEAGAAAVGAAVVVAGLDEQQLVGVLRVGDLRARADRGRAEAQVGAVVGRVQPARGREHEVVGVAQPRGVRRDVAAGRDLDQLAVALVIVGLPVAGLDVVHCAVEVGA